MENCIFCKIINGDIPCYKIYEDDLVVAFLDINPISNGHTLIVPKQHFQDLYDIDNNVLNHILEIAKKIAKQITAKLNCDGFTLVQNNGAVQEVKHFHLHIHPYYKNSEVMKVEDCFKILNI